MRVGVIGDLHEPFSHPMYLRFVTAIFEAWSIDEVIFIGDVVDLHALSFWDHDPDGLSAADEAGRAHDAVARWYRRFEESRVCIGNHDERHYRMARKAGMPDRFLKSYREVWSTPRWRWAYEHRLEGVQYEHGTGSSGKDAAINLAIQKRTSVAIGHVHTYAGVKYHANPTGRVFGMNVGCGIDVRAYAFAYGRTFPVRPVLGCGVVVDGAAYFEPMPCGPGEKYHRRRAGRREQPRRYIRERKPR